MAQILLNTWALFLSFAIISLGHGLQGTLIGVRAVLEDFSLISTGLIIAGYYFGFLGGSIVIPLFIQRVGHIRVFAALASLASIAILLHSLFLDPTLWFLIRMLTGFCIAGIFIIMESWLNNKSTNTTRGKLLSFYFIITFSFVGIGQLLLNLSNPVKMDLFILVSILLSFALLPILLSVTAAPEFSNPKRISFKELYVISPLGFIGAFITGLSHSAVFGFGAVYAVAKGFDTFYVSIFMLIIIIFGALFQWPIGTLSDRFDRRIMLISVTLIASVLSIFIVATSYLSLILFFIIVAFYSGMSLPMYSLAVAHINDFIQPDEIVGVSATLQFIVGVGAILGPISASLFMNILGADGFFVYLFLTHLSLGLFGIYRISKRAKPENLESQYVPLPRNISAIGMGLNPKTDIKKDK